MLAWRLFLCAAASAALAVQAPEYRGPQWSAFVLRLYAPFLEPGDAAGPRRGDELRILGFHVTGREGDMTFRIWGIDGKAAFTMTAHGKGLASLTTEFDGGESAGLRVWRHRHGYTRDNRGRYWWNTLGERTEPLEPRLGGLYDDFLRGVWRVWVTRRIQERLAGSLTPPVAAGPERLAQEIPISFDATGMVGTAPVDLSLRFWGVPVRLHFTLAPALPSEEDPWIIGLTDRVTLGYNRQDWRHRHGYRISFWGDYRWDDDFPGPRPDLQVNGALLDSLLSRTMRFWADSCVNIACSGLDQDLKKAVSSVRTNTP